MKFLYYFTFIVLAVSNCFSQTDISGKIYDEQSKQPVSGITVIISGSSVTKSSVTDSEGIFKINLPSENDYTLTIDETENYKSYSEKIKVTSKNQLIEINLTPKTYKLNDVYVYGVTKNYERLVDAPAAVDVLYPETINEKARGNQIAGALSGMNGLDILKNGATDYIVNTRGFNGGLNRRILVLQDG
ncbi:MAG TPA: carboxypeptidase-like regulatory domain-containing protein, partial [Ignavibacteria bacterium]|nr:carboxypeptidase-like regulatory domain-containing protein [Ignavibacteria bacterium]